MKDSLHVQTVLDEIPNILFSHYGEYDVQRKYGVCKKTGGNVGLVVFWSQRSSFKKFRFCSNLQPRTKQYTMLARKNILKNL